MKMKMGMLPAVGLSMAAGAAVLMMTKPKKKPGNVQKAAGKALKAVGEVVENYNGMKM